MRGIVHSHQICSLFTLLCVLCAGSLFAQTSGGFDTLSGPLPARVKAGPRPYLVISDIEVRAFMVVTIEAGAVFLFRNFTGLHVQGRLIADGSESKPVVFTSEFDASYNQNSSMLPNPYDWNGVYIHGDGIGSFMTNINVLYSVYGLISDTKFIRITHGSFLHNGKSDLVIEGTAHQVNGEPYDYLLSTKDATVDGVPVEILKDPLATRRTTARYSGLSAMVGGLGAGIYSSIALRNALEQFDARSSRDTSNTVYYETDDWQAARSKRNGSILALSGSIAVCVLGSMGFAWSFTF